VLLHLNKLSRNRENTNNNEMITLEKLTQFIHEKLGYKPTTKVTYYEVIGDWIQLQFDNVMGEVVKLERYYNWLQSVREEKINQIL
jgi:hypothetical protein